MKFSSQKLSSVCPSPSNPANVDTIGQKLWQVLRSPGYRRSLFFRRILATMCLVAAGLLALAQAHSHTTELLVYATDLPAGHIVEETDLRIISVPAESKQWVPELEIADLVGTVLLQPRAAGAQVYSEDVLYENRLAAHPELQLVPIQLATQAWTEIVHPGDEIHLLRPASEAELADPDFHPEIIAHNALVVATPTPAAHSDAPTLFDDGVILVGLSPVVAGQVASFGLHFPFAMVIASSASQ
ncbi:MAG: SAF domain-containing protein [Corynebacterium sp.]|nr:SAF domain-containing protein [Corynebacterium sp.]